MQESIAGSARSILLILSFVIIASALAHAGDDADDWTHISFGDGGTNCNLAYRPGTSIVGVVTRELVVTDEQSSINIVYWECDETGVLSSQLVANVPWLAYRGMSLAYTSDGYPAVAWICDNVSASPPHGAFWVYYCRLLPGSPDYWSSPLMVDWYSGIGEDCCDCAIMPMFVRRAFIELGFDKRPDEHRDEPHIIYGIDYAYFDEQMCADGDGVIHWVHIRTLTAPTPDGPWPPIPTTLTPLNTLFGPASVTSGGATVSGALATSNVTCPKLVFTDPVNGCLSYATFDGQWVVQDPCFVSGHFPSMVLDPSTGDPRISYTYNHNDIRFVSMTSGVWSTPITVRDDTVSIQSELSIGVTSSATVMKLATGGYGFGAVNAYQYSGGAWSMMTPDGQVTYHGLPPRILVNPGSPYDPWVLTNFDDGLGLAKYGETVGGCGSAPVSRGRSIAPSASKALVPAMLAAMALIAWRIRRRKPTVLS